MRGEPMISLIAAMGHDRAIGIDNRMPWHLPADFQHFRRITLGKPVVMGRKTFESIGRPLPDRHNVVVTRDAAWRHDGVTVAPSIEAALAACGAVDEVMIIGGASFYAQLLPRAERLYLTFVDGDFEADAWFPAWEPAEWQEIERNDHPADARNSHAMTFVTLQRLR